jgi:hypothetical protein
VDFCGTPQRKGLISLSVRAGNFDLASAFSHGLAALSIGACFYRPGTPKGGLAVLQSEFLWIWLPAALLALSVWLMRGRAAPSA